MAAKSDDNTARNKALDIAVAQLEKQFGRGTLLRLGDDHFVQKVRAISTGSLSLDIATGVGGFPRGRVVEIFGPEASGKTTLALHAVANAQKQNGIACYIDAEHALDPSFAGKIGVDVDNLLVSQPDTAEQALEICEALVRSNAVDIIVVDSVAAMVPKAEVEGDMGDSHMGLQARLMSQALRKLTAAISRSKTLVIFINQIRMKIGVMFGSPETTTGGQALKFYASMRIEIRRISTVKDKEESVGNRVRAKVVKNKLSPPFRSAEFEILFDEGISEEGDVLDLAIADKLIQKSGSWFSLDGENLGQGRENTRIFLKDHPEIVERLKSELLKAKGLTWLDSPDEAGQDANSQEEKAEVSD
ncbi:MAG TPA: recombinase RecA [Candidatus Hydrogenedentes bacterium]|jgi:recombination protein RecA|nr:recombinase RecA [Candidatus Hydrogenedentota bacterium]MDY0033620.1 recombinase RecA [FCB group bacterium]NLT60942.1 recombinase RecA [Candidatus Hydrogenedentota bacterium]HNZ17983.1 recombinase RecA [Candidatus Hydrogenedentota bacterium]HOH35218.1 recombinase RecA [Candidatus Hydrogenedentota bacterium]